MKHHTPDVIAELKQLREVCGKHGMTKCATCKSMRNCCKSHHVCRAHGKPICDNCRAGFTVNVERVRAVLPDDADRFDNTSASGVWK